MTLKTDELDVSAVVARTRELVQPAMRVAIGNIPDAHMRLIAGYQLGWWDAEGNETDASGKAVRPALTVLAAEACGADAELAVPAAAAIELVHNFSLLHDDIMDRDVVRRHRATGWVVFGEGQAILAGNAMLVAAVAELMQHGAHAERAVPVLLDTVQALISGQSADLALERQADVDLAAVRQMQDGKTAALLACCTGLGAISAGASADVVDLLTDVGRRLGLGFQLVDDVLGVVGDSDVTGKSASSDVRSGKRSAPIVAALGSGTAAGRELADLLGEIPPESDADVARAVELVRAAGGIDWALREAETLLTGALDLLTDAQLRGEQGARGVTELRQLAAFLVRRDW